ncbi:MAG: tellurium resistance protein [Jatrophihabitantaceae bacterium]
MGIDYTKRTPEQSASTPVSLSKITLTKAAPTVSLTKHGSATGTMRVNLNWTARPSSGGRLFGRPAAIDLDIGCLYEFTDGSKGVVQALGNAFAARPAGMTGNVIWLDGDDRSGSNAAGENLFIDLAQVDRIRRVMVFALIYEGVPNWAAADAVVTLFPASGPQVEVRLDEPRDGARICGIAMLEQSGGELSVRREVNYLNGSQAALDQAYGWGMRWVAGRK